MIVNIVIFILIAGLALECYLMHGELERRFNDIVEIHNHIWDIKSLILRKNLGDKVYYGGMEYEDYIEKLRREDPLLFFDMDYKEMKEHKQECLNSMTKEELIAKISQLEEVVNRLNKK